MEVSRRDFLRFSVGAAGGTALAGLAGSGVNLGPVVAQAQELRIKDAKVTPSICPYCSVGCATLVHTINGQIVNIEGDPRSPHNEGTLCARRAQRSFSCTLIRTVLFRFSIVLRALPNGKFGTWIER
jgi:formate dehydrogenase major subunit